MINRLHTGELVSRVVVHNKVAYLSGLTATDKTKGIEDQTREVLVRIEGVLEEVGSDKTRLLTSTIWLADFADKDAMNEVWSKWLASGTAPARAALEGELGEGVLVEIMVMAACD